MSDKIKRVLVLVFGATTGATLYEFIVGRGPDPKFLTPILYNLSI